MALLWDRIVQLLPTTSYNSCMPFRLFSAKVCNSLSRREAPSLLNSSEPSHLLGATSSPTSGNPSFSALLDSFTIPSAVKIVGNSFLVGTECCLECPCQFRRGGDGDSCENDATVLPVPPRFRTVAKELAILREEREDTTEATAIAAVCPGTCGVTRLSTLGFALGISTEDAKSRVGSCRCCCC